MNASVFILACIYGRRRVGWGVDDGEVRVCTPGSACVEDRFISSPHTEKATAGNLGVGYVAMMSCVRRSLGGVDHGL